MNRLAAIQWIRQRLDELNQRERTLVIGGTVVLGLALVWSILIQPALQTIQTAPDEQAALTDKAAKVLRAAADLQQLRGARSQVRLTAGDIQPRLQQMLAEHGLKDTASLQRTEEGYYEVKFDKSPAAGVLAWLNDVQAIATLTPVKGEIEKNEAAIVSGSLMFAGKGETPGKAP